MKGSGSGVKRKAKKINKIFAHLKKKRNKKIITRYLGGWLQ